MAIRATNALAVKVEEAKRKRKELRKCQTNLWYLLTEYLGYAWNPDAGSKKSRFKGQGLTERLHKPICDMLDRHAGDPLIFMEIARGHHKTTIFVGMVIQDILNDPNVALMYFQDTDALATTFVEEVADHLLTNKKLRSLDPIGVYPDDYYIEEKAGKPYRVFPAPNSKKHLVKQPYAKLMVNRSSFSRFPTLAGFGAGTSITGAHGDKGYLDDIIGERAIADNQVTKRTQWVQRTVFNVVSSKVIRGIGTPWCDYGLYAHIREDKDWRSVVIPCAIKERLRDVDWDAKKIHLTRCDEFSNPVFGPEEHKPKQREFLKFTRRQMKADFDAQMMVDPSPSGQKPWKSKWEERMFLTMDECKGSGSIFVLSDPAPAYSSMGRDGMAKDRGDGSKDEWALAVVKRMPYKDRMITVLLWGEASREWTLAQGFDKACDLMRHFCTPFFFNESYGGLQIDYTQPFMDAARRNNTNVRYDYIGGDPRLMKFKNSYISGAKNHRFADLCSQVEQGEFYISRGCPKSFLENEADPDCGLLHQMRGWRPDPVSNRNSLRYDDRADVVARSTDPALEVLSPNLDYSEDAVDSFWHAAEEEPHEQNRSLYCGI